MFCLCTTRNWFYIDAVQILIENMLCKMGHRIFKAKTSFSPRENRSRRSFTCKLRIMLVVSTSLFNIKEFPAHLIYELVSRFHDDMSRYFPTGWTNMYHFLKMLEITFGFLFHFFQKTLKMSIFIRHFRTRTMRSVPFPV